MSETTESETKSQVRITNTTTNGNGSLVPTVLSIKASAFYNYIISLRNECDKTYTPNRHKEFDHLPLLAIWDLADTGEEFFYDSEKDLPTETVYNSKGIPVLIILPEDANEDMGVNKFEVLDDETQEKVSTYIKENPVTPFTMRVERTTSKQDE